jgi:prevent-host-death family protein
MRRVNVLDARTRFSALLRDVASGEEVIITNHGREVARLSAIAPPARPRVYGALREVPDRRSPTEAEVRAALGPMSEAEAEALGWA